MHESYIFLKSRSLLENRGLKKVTVFLGINSIGNTMPRVTIEYGGGLISAIKINVGP